MSLAFIYVDLFTHNLKFVLAMRGFPSIWFLNLALLVPQARLWCLRLFSYLSSSVLAVLATILMSVSF